MLSGDRMEFTRGGVERRDKLRRDGDFGELALNVGGAHNVHLLDLQSNTSRNRGDRNGSKARSKT